MTTRILYIISIIIIFTITGYSQTIPDFKKSKDNRWVDSLMSKLSLEQKIAQLFMIQAYSNKNQIYNEDLLKLVEEKQVGGIIFMQGSPVKQNNLCNLLQEKSRIPLLMAIDAENGLGFRLDSTLNYPNMLTLGAIIDDTIIYKMGVEIGKQLRMTGINMNLAPVSDININPDNPVIGYRSFGENKYKVAKKAWLYANGMQNSGVIATAKHFPGHGDTKFDSHFVMPIINKTKKQLDSTEIYPFKYLIDKGIFAVMTGHLHLSAYDSDSKRPATLSNNLINKKLKNDLGFNGLVITDAMNMKGLGVNIKSGENAVKALKAGNDIIEIMPNLENALAAVKNAVSTGILSVAEIDEKCRKILLAKQWIGLNNNRKVSNKNLYEKVNNKYFQLTQRLLFEKSLTVIKNQNDIIPLKNIDTLKIACITFDKEDKSPFQSLLNNYTEVINFNISKHSDNKKIESVLNQLNQFNLIILGFNETKQLPGMRYNITDQQIYLSDKILELNKKTIVAYFGNPYSLKFIPSVLKAESVILAYQEDKIVQELAAQLIFGAIGATGKLPVTISKDFPEDSGLDIKPIGRLKYSIPEEENIESNYLESKIDSLANLGIRKNAFPGCQVLVSINGKVILKKSYGFLTYDKQIQVNDNTIYDLASITKITTALPVIMKLYDNKLIGLDKPIVNIFPEFEKTDKSTITLRQILTHTSRFQSGLPVWLESPKKDKIREDIFNNYPTANYKIRVSPSLYLKSDFTEELLSEIAKSKLRLKTEFHYSDIGFSILPLLIERQSKNDFEIIHEKEFIKPLGATTLGYNPYKRFPLTRIAPTEFDQKFRKKLIHGFVHDEMASIMGGVSGNAGLFGSANDLAKFMQMYLQKGYYGGKFYISEQTINYFTKDSYADAKNRRGLGFDKPKPSGAALPNSLPTPAAGKESYGHSGFTGTFVWNDPQNKLIFIFLSNRIYPSRNNTELYNLNIRSEMHREIYNSLSNSTK